MPRRNQNVCFRSVCACNLETTEVGVAFGGGSRFYLGNKRRFANIVSRVKGAHHNTKRGTKIADGLNFKVEIATDGGFCPQHPHPADKEFGVGRSRDTLAILWE